MLAGVGANPLRWRRGCHTFRLHIASPVERGTRMSQALPYVTPVAPRLAPPGIIPRLSAMMFLQFAIQGAWLPLLFQYFNEYRAFSATQVGWLLAFGAIGAVVSPFIAGQLADRHMNAEWFMTLSHVIGAVVVWIFAEVTNLYALSALSFFYGVLYTPTLATANAISFAHLPDRDRDFGKVRVWGTIGWIVVGISVGQYLYRTQTPSLDSAVQQLVEDKQYSSEEAAALTTEYKDTIDPQNKDLAKKFGTFKG